MRTLAPLFLLFAASPAVAAVIVLGNFSKDEVAVTVTDSSGKPQTVKLTAFQVVPITVGGPADITFPTTGGKTTLRLDAYNAYALSPDRDAGLKLEGIELPGMPHEDDAKPEPKPAPRAVLKVPVTLLVDDDDTRTDRVWQPLAKARLEMAAAAVEAHCGVKFEFAAFATWKIDPTANTVSAMLGDFQKAVKLKPGHVAIGWTYRQTPLRDDTVGATGGAGSSHILLRDGRPKDETEKAEVLAHFLGQALGAVHSPDSGSVMRSRLGDGFALSKGYKMRFDPLNTLAMNLWADEFRKGPGRKVADFSAANKARLIRVYGALQNEVPNNPAPGRYIKVLEGAEPDPAEEKKKPTP
jgi:hypothetical protein